MNVVGKMNIRTTIIKNVTAREKKYEDHPFLVNLDINSKIYLAKQDLKDHTYKI
jgi:hypothetical protein